MNWDLEMRRGGGARGWLFFALVVELVMLWLGWLFRGFEPLHYCFLPSGPGMVIALYAKETFTWAVFKNDIKGIFGSVTRNHWKIPSVDDHQTINSTIHRPPKDP